MRVKPILLYRAPGSVRLPVVVTDFAEEEGLTILQPANDREIVDIVNRGYPACLVLDTRGDPGFIQLCRTLKLDPFSAVVPVMLYAPDADDSVVQEALLLGADEVLTNEMTEREQSLRCRMLLRRADSALSVHPTTRLPGTGQIARDIAERVGSGERFAVCYADLDRFKEFNDHYGYGKGDQVILVVSRILRDVVKAYAPDGFIGHIGGDDFVFNLPIDAMCQACEEIIEIFDQLIPFQYSSEDRERGCFVGKDRRGDEYEVPLMTLSIGVVTNKRREFGHPGRVSDLATEMKGYAKTLSGSVYAVDRRSDQLPVPAGTIEDIDEDPESLVLS